MYKHSDKLLPIIALTLLACVGCRKVSESGYHVMAYDGLRKEWTVNYKDFDSSLGTYHRKRFVLACDSYEYNGGGFKHGPDVCDLQVGKQFMTTLGNAPGPHYFVDPSMKSPGTGELQFYFAEDEGDKHEVQFFKILREEELPDSK